MPRKFQPRSGSSSQVRRLQLRHCIFGMYNKYDGTGYLPARKEASSVEALKLLLEGSPVAEATADWNANPEYKSIYKELDHVEEIDFYVIT